MNIRLGVVTATVIALLGIGGMAMANGQQEPPAGQAAANPPGRGVAAGQGMAAGQGLGAGQGVGVGQGGGQGRLAGSGSYGGDAAQAQAFRSTELAALAAMSVGTLQAEELASLLYIWEEEKLARDVYTKLGELYKLPLFLNIARSEQTHMDQMAFLLERYKLTNPGTDSPGVFRDPGLAAAYKELVARGSESLEKAIGVGIAIEEMDIQDLQKAIQSSANQDVQYVLNQLLMGSRNHLAAFNRQAQR
jgi:hypothetical protein